MHFVPWIDMEVLYHRVPKKIQEELNALVEVQGRLVKDVEQQETAREQFLVSLVEVDLDRGVLSPLLADIAERLKDVPGVGAAAHEDADWALD